MEPIASHARSPRESDYSGARADEAWSPGADAQPSGADSPTQITGARVAFIAFNGEEGKDCLYVAEAEGTLWEIGTSGEGRRELGGADWRYGELSGGAPCARLPCPAWNPDGHEFIAVSRVPRDQWSDPTAGWGLHVIRTDGGGETELDLGPMASSPQGWDWAGGRIVFSKDRATYGYQPIDGRIVPLANTGPYLGLRHTGDAAVFQKGCEPGRAAWTAFDLQFADDIGAQGAVRWPNWAPGELVVFECDGRLWVANFTDRASASDLGPGRDPHVFRFEWYRPASPTPTWSPTLSTLPATVAPLALRNKGAVYDMLFQAASRTLLQVAADEQHLGARIGFLAVLRAPITNPPSLGS